MLGWAVSEVAVAVTSGFPPYTPTVGAELVAAETNRLVPDALVP
jgi:hypothetical protein